MWLNVDTHSGTIIKFEKKYKLVEKLSIPQDCQAPEDAEICSSFYKELNMIKVTNHISYTNTLDYTFVQPATEAQLRTIYRTYKDIPDVRLTYDIVDYGKPHQNPRYPHAYSTNSYCRGYREMLTDLRECNYLVN